MSNEIKTMVGMTFGRFRVLEMAGTGKYGALWKCVCECGQLRIVRGTALRAGMSRSCGCLASEIAAKRLTKHGHARPKFRTSEYVIWVDMIQRCTNPRSAAYADYGGRGISVCERWMKFEAFLVDMGARPTNHTLDRRDNNKGYLPENCWWRTAQQQGRNRRSNLLIEFQGTKLTLAEWAERTGLRRDTISYRLRSGWDTGLALTTPSERHAC
ncbi:MAG: hypothetical protein ACYC9K_01070 [Sulfuricaulis sp.]